MIQQDLIGFFNSVPHSRICSALQLMLYRLQKHFGQTADDLAFQVDHKAGTNDVRIFKGQRRFRGSNTKVLQIRHVMELTEFLLQSAYFKVGVDTYCQMQGACMGSLLAPVPCAMVAAEQENLKSRVCAPISWTHGCFAVSGMRTTGASSCAAPNSRQIGQNLISMVCPLSLNVCQVRSC